METWLFILISITIAALLKAFINLISHNKNKLPPGPFHFPILSNLHWLHKSISELEQILKNLHAKLGPVITLHIGPRPVVLIADHSLAHKALIQNGAFFADRPPASVTNKILSSNQNNVTSGFYGPKWRLFRRNLKTEILHPSRVKSYKHACKWVLEILLNRFKSESKYDDPIQVMGHFQYAMFCLLVLMCFGDKLDESQIKEIEKVQRSQLLSLGKFSILDFWPMLTKIIFRKKWGQFLRLLKDQENVLIPLIRVRKKIKEERFREAREENEYVLSYVDTLLDLQLPEEKRKLDEGEIMGLCSEFLNGGTDTTSTALQWIMANLVKYPHVQERLYLEIKGIVEKEEEEVREEELSKMPYLKAVILEGLRRHPPGHFVLPHAVTEDIILDNKYVISRNKSVNFMVAEMGRDSKVWKDPMAFKPERFLNENGEVDRDFDITGTREIKMMPFGVGRRICPALGLAMLHLEYFVANFVWNFQWKAVNGDGVDLSEKDEFTVVMKNPLQVHLSPRIN